VTRQHDLGSSPFAGRFLAPALAILLAAGCFRGEDLGKIYCVTDQNCPSGHICVNVTKPGGCRKKADAPLDGGALDSTSPIDGVSPIDRTTVDIALESSPIGLDGSPASLDQGETESVDVATGAADRNVTADVALPDAPLDSPPSLPDTAGQTHLDAPQAVDSPTDLPIVVDASKAIGVQCQNGNECGSTYCVEGFCCDGPCTGQCQSCSMQTKAGTCTNVTGAPQLGKAACGGTGDCAGTCNGASPSCFFPDAQTSCGAASCTSGVATSGRSCNSSGGCGAATTTPCGSYICGSTSCLTSCTTVADCVSDAVCSGGTCVACGSGQTVCSNQCVNLKTDNNHCGFRTTVACGSGRQCSGGVCKLVDGQACTSNADCASAVCNTFYYDGDGDGYPVSGNSVGFCNVTSSPNSGYIPARSDGTWDCCDTDSTVNPGVLLTSFFIDAGNNCHTWDWNCSGQAEKKQEQIAGPCWFDSTSSSCVSTTAPGYPSAACGGSYVVSQGCMVTSPGNCTSTSSQNAPVACH